MAQVFLPLVPIVPVEISHLQMTANRRNSQDADDIKDTVRHGKAAATLFDAGGERGQFSVS